MRAGLAIRTLLVAASLCASPARCQTEDPSDPPAPPLFEVQDLFENVRIPNLVVAMDGRVLAFAKKGPSAYSSLAAGNDGTVYLLFERGENKLYESIAIARFNLAWLAGTQNWHKYFKD